MFPQKRQEDTRKPNLTMNHDILTVEQIELLEFSPIKNSAIITLFRDLDGNYRGFMQKDGKLIQAREISPEYTLQKLLTHE
jgi:hypothetical protein